MMRSQEIGGVSPDDVVKVGGALGVLWALGRFILGPRVRRSLQDVLKPEIDTLKEAADIASRTANELEGMVIRLRKMEEDLEVIEAIAADNREWMRETHAFLSYALQIDRRESERRELPEVPRVPERRRRDRRTDL
jgi:hypothetical protein